MLSNFLYTFTFVSGYFEDMSTRCLPCSYCQYSSTFRIVKECVREGGSESPVSCWPEPRFVLRSATTGTVYDFT